jgi:anti-anti-sigma factor
LESGPPLSITELSVDGEVRLAVAGELDIASGAELIARIEQFELSHPHTLGLDLSEVTFMDVAGMRVLLEVAQRAKSRKTRFVIHNPRRCASRVFGLTAVDQQLEIVFDELPAS